MRFGGPVLREWEGPDDWAEQVASWGFSAVYCPAQADDDDATVAAYAAAAERIGAVVAEVGAWSNPLSRDESTRREALAKCKRQLALAERIGARCCVNIAGSRGAVWHGPCGEDLTDEGFDAVVQSVREILDEVKPTRTFYALETMPWLPPDSTDSYVALIDAIDRERFAVHFDPVNLVNCPRRYYDTARVIREFCAKLGPRVRSCHAKDIVISSQLTLHLDETRPGLGGLDYDTFLRELDKLDPDTPLMMEHLKTPEEYAEAAAFIRRKAADADVLLSPSGRRGA